MALRFQEEFGISSTFGISDGEPAEITIGYVVFGAKTEGVDVKIVGACNIIDGNGSDLNLHTRHPSENTAHRRRP